MNLMLRFLFNTFVNRALRSGTCAVMQIEHRGAIRNEKGSSYKLSPLSTRLTPSGGPADFWVKNEDDDENNNR
jgi:hypothetical protein